MSDGAPSPAAEPAPETLVAEPLVAEPAPSRSPMRRRSFDNRPALSPDQRRRQARIVRLAMDELGSADAIRGFLNDHHDALGGRPLDLALASDAGLAAAEALILVPPAPRG